LLLSNRQETPYLYSFIVYIIVILDFLTLVIRNSDYAVW
jgi:hypothetical protein